MPLGLCCVVTEERQMLALFFFFFPSVVEDLQRQMQIFWQREMFICPYRSPRAFQEVSIQEASFTLFFCSVFYLPLQPLQMLVLGPSL